MGIYSNLSPVDCIRHVVATCEERSANLDITTTANAPEHGEAWHVWIDGYHDPKGEFNDLIEESKALMQRLGIEPMAAYPRPQNETLEVKALGPISVLTPVGGDMAMYYRDLLARARAALDLYWRYRKDGIYIESPGWMSAKEDYQLLIRVVEVLLQACGVFVGTAKSAVPSYALRQRVRELFLQQEQQPSVVVADTKPQGAEIPVIHWNQPLIDARFQELTDRLVILEKAVLAPKG